MNGLHGVNGWSGWQWVLLIEGIPSVIMAFVVLAFMANNIDAAKWLSPEEKAMLKANLQTDNKG